MANMQAATTADDGRTKGSPNVTGNVKEGSSVLEIKKIARSFYFKAEACNESIFCQKTIFIQIFAVFR